MSQLDSKQESVESKQEENNQQPQPLPYNQQYKKQESVESKGDEKDENDEEDEKDEKDENNQEHKPKLNKKKPPPNELNFKLEDIDDDYIDNTRKIYYKQCPSLRHQLQQQDLFILLSFERKNDYPLLIYLIDAYLRDRLQYFFDNKKALTVSEWGNKYKTLNKLLKDAKESKKIKRTILSGMDIYFNRYCQPIMLPTQFRINDSIHRFVQCIQEVYGLIAAILQNPIEIPPFQIDLLIIPQDVTDMTKVVGDAEDDNDDEDDFDDDESESDDDDDDDDEESENKEDGEEIGNITDKLQKYNNIKYAQRSAASPDIFRELRHLYEDYKSKCNGLSNMKKDISAQTSTLSESDIKENDECISPKSMTITQTESTSTLSTQNGNKFVTETVSSQTLQNGGNTAPTRIVYGDVDDIGGDLRNLPHHKRLCIVIDRRLGKLAKIKEDKNEIYMFEAPIYNNIPPNFVKEWYFESSYQCILPGITNQHNIKSKSSMDGWINIFSFHVEQEKEIRCYFYRDGQILRFMPDDVIDLLPELFEETAYENKKWIDQEKKTKYNINRLKWEDEDFENFRKQLQS